MRGFETVIFKVKILGVLSSALRILGMPWGQKGHFFEKKKNKQPERLLSSESVGWRCEGDRERLRQTSWSRWMLTVNSCLSPLSRRSSLVSKGSWMDGAVVNALHPHSSGTRCPCKIRVYKGLCLLHQCRGCIMGAESHRWSHYLPYPRYQTRPQARCQKST